MIETSLVFDSAALQARVEGFERDVLRAARDSVRFVGGETEYRLERATEQAGLGRLAKAWNNTVYPRSGLSAAPTAVVYPKGSNRTIGALLAYTRGAKVKGTRGQYLAIPTPAAGPRRFDRAGTILTPETWERRTGLKLRFIPGKRRDRGLLVLDEGRVLKSGRARLETARRRDAGKATNSIPIFVLVKQVEIKKRFSVSALLPGARVELEEYFVGLMNNLINNFNSGGGNGNTI